MRTLAVAIGTILIIGLLSGCLAVSNKPVSIAQTWVAENGEVHVAQVLEGSGYQNTEEAISISNNLTWEYEAGPPVTGEPQWDIATVMATARFNHVLRDENRKGRYVLTGGKVRIHIVVDLEGSEVIAFTTMQDQYYEPYGGVELETTDE